MKLHKPYRPLFILSMTSLLAIPLCQHRAAASQGYAARVLHAFVTNIENDGVPSGNALIKASDGNYYGVTQHGGSNGVGVLFRITSGGFYTILHTFGIGSDGQVPHGGLVIGNDGNLYGTTQLGGVGGGTAYKVALDGSGYTIIHQFGTGAPPNDGGGPEGSLILGSDGNFYGTTLRGGSANFGVVFKMTAGGVVTILHSFADGSVTNDGETPADPLIQGPDGTLYGTTSVGGSSQVGTVFKLNTDGTGYTILHRFQDGSVANDGAQPTNPPVIGSDGNLYGSTYTSADFNGTIYRVSTSGTNYSVVHHFADGSIPNEGINPIARIISAPDGSMYGTTDAGGTAGQGTIFKLTTSGAVTMVYSFANNDGRSPNGDLLLDTDGKFYGMADSGGVVNKGTIYRVFPANLVISAPSAATAGVFFNATVTARDDSNTLVTDYGGTVHFTSSDPSATLPTDLTLTNGSGSFTATFYAAAPIAIRARDTAHSDLTNTANVSVNPGPFDHLTLTTPTTATAGLAFYAMLSARDQYNNVVKSFTDTIHIDSTDPQAVLPANFVLLGGAKQVSIKLQTPGTKTITTTDTNNSASVTSGNIDVGTLISKYVITGPASSTVNAVNTYNITAKDTVGNTVPGYTGTVHITSTDLNASVPGDITLTNGTGTFQVTFQTKGAQKVNANDTANAAIKGLAATTVR